MPLACLNNMSVSIDAGKAAGGPNNDVGMAEATGG